MYSTCRTLVMCSYEKAVCFVSVAIIEVIVAVAHDLLFWVRCFG